MIWEFVKGLVSPVTEMVKGWQERKKVKLENELKLSNAVTEAKIDRLKTQQMADIAWENTALVNAGIKDEIMMIVILTPMVLCFIPGGAALVKEGFTAMRESLPSYWEYAFLATVGVSYGLKKWTDLKSIMNGNKITDLFACDGKEEELK
jgi:hypothetical protein